MSWDWDVDKLQKENTLRAVAACEMKDGVPVYVMGSMYFTHGFNPTEEEVRAFTLSEGDLRSKGAYIEAEKYIIVRYAKDDKGITSINLKESNRNEEYEATDAAVCFNDKGMIIILGDRDDTGGLVSTVAYDTIAKIGKEQKC